MKKYVINDKNQAMPSRILPVSEKHLLHRTIQPLHGLAMLEF